MRINNREPFISNIIKYINDVAGIRIICSFTTDIYTIAELIAHQNDVNVLKIKDYISRPKANGYMSYHMIVSVPVYLSQKVIYTKVEIQIRTIAMDFWASLEHKIYYKFDGQAPEHIRRELKECADASIFRSKNAGVREWKFKITGNLCIRSNPGRWSIPKQRKPLPDFLVL